MSRPKLEVADIFRAHGPAYRHEHAGHLNLPQLKVMSAIEACRTAALGGHVAACTKCGHQHVAYNSCRNRHCPKCQGAASREWMQARIEDLLPVEYFHVVFTLPAQIADIAHQNKAAVYGLLFKASAETLLTIAADPNANELEVIARLKREALHKHSDQAEKVKTAWLKVRAAKIAGPDANEEAFEKAQAIAKRALEKACLSGGFVIQVQIGNDIRDVTVEELLASPEVFHGLTTRDPLEPGYDGARLVGKLFLDGPIKTLHSFARGEATYRLECQVHEIQHVKGRLDETVNETINVLRQESDVFDRGQDLVLVSIGKIHKLSENALDQFLGQVIQYSNIDRKGSHMVATLYADICKQMTFK